MGWRETVAREMEEPKQLPEMTTIYDAQTQSVQLILWSDYVGKGYEAHDLTQRARRRRTEGFKRTVAKNEHLPEDVEGCDIAHPFRDFMEESLRVTNEKVKIELEKTTKALQAEMEAIKKSQEEAVKENEMLKAMLAESEKCIEALKEDMDQVQKATWDNRNFRIDVKDQLATVEAHLEKTVGFDPQVKEKGQGHSTISQGQGYSNMKKAPIPDYTTVYNPRTKMAELKLLGEYYSTPGCSQPKQDWAVIYDEATQGTKLVFWRDYVKFHQPFFQKARREKNIKELEQKFDKDLEFAPLAVRKKVAMMKFWLKTVELPMEDNFRQAYEKARGLLAEGSQVGVEVPKAIYQTLAEVDFGLVWEHQTPLVHFEGSYSFLKEFRRRLQCEDKNFPKLPIRDYMKPKKAVEQRVEKGQLDQKVGEKQQKKAPPAPAKPTRNLWEGSSSYMMSEAAGHELDPFSSMFLLS